MQPVSQSRVRLPASSSWILLSLSRQSTTQPFDGTLPPLNPLPLPRVTSGVLVREAQRTKATTCSTESGKTTISGTSRSIAVPSQAYGIVSTFSVTI